jgi:signal transduction histidine kinase
MADRYKSHFLASASHDLRQPLHALNLFVAQLQTETNPAERSRVVSRIDAAVASMNELFEALLDMTKLEAGILQANPAEFAVQRLLDRIETTFAELADKKGLNLRVVPCSAWVRSDPILLERILLNLVGNAVRYTARGGSGGLPPPRHAGAHRRLRYRRRHSGGSTPEHIQRVLPAGEPCSGRQGGARPRPCHR